MYSAKVLGKIQLLSMRVKYGDESQENSLNSIVSDIIQAIVFHCVKKVKFRRTQPPAIDLEVLGDVVWKK